MDSISDSRLNTSNDSLGTTTGDSVPTHSNTIHADTPRPSAYDNTSMSDKSVDEEALQDDLLATQMQATASYLSGNISPQQKAAAIAAFHAMLSVAEGESEAKPLDLTESPPKSLMGYGPSIRTAKSKIYLTNDQFTPTPRKIKASLVLPWKQKPKTNLRKG